MAATADSKQEAGEVDVPLAEAGSASHDTEERASDDEQHVLEPQPKCDICGITTTSQAHMEVRLPLFLCAWKCLQKTVREMLLEIPGH